MAVVDVPDGVFLEYPVIWAQNTSTSWQAICIVEHKIVGVLAEMLRENVVDLIVFVEAEITRSRIYFIGTIGSVEVRISVNP